MSFFDLYVQLAQVPNHETVQSSKNPVWKLEPLDAEQQAPAMRDDISDELWIKTLGFVPER